MITPKRKKFHLYVTLLCYNLMTFSLGQKMDRQMFRLLKSDKLKAMWKKEVAAYFSSTPNIFLHEEK
jgi:hypothetical protein